MLSNRDVSRLFSIYAELLLLHNTDERLSSLLSAAAYRLRNIDEPIVQLGKVELAKIFHTKQIQNRQLQVQQVSNLYFYYHIGSL